MVSASLTSRDNVLCIGFYASQINHVVETVADLPLPLLFAPISVIAGLLPPVKPYGYFGYGLFPSGLGLPLLFLMSFYRQGFTVNYFSRDS